jgi:GntR family transcriptional regulator of vanillate catabolism
MIKQRSVREQDDTAPSQTLTAVLGLRGLIVDGAFKGGERIAEPFLVERFGVSRTPARAALAQLKEEGLLDPLPSGGYMVSSFTEKDVFDAIELRGTLEGLAVRFAAERGVAPTLIMRMEACLHELDAAVEEFARTYNPNSYVVANDKFHSLLVDAGQSKMVRRALDKIMSLPFAAPNAFVQSTRADVPEAVIIMRNAQAQHRAIIEAIRNREGKRAEAITNEHSRSAWQYLRIAFNEHGAEIKFPGLDLRRA